MTLPPVDDRRIDAELVGRLNAALDEQADLLRQRAGEMDELAQALCKNDNDRLERLLAEMGRSQHRQAQADRALQALREELADALGWQVAAVRLGRLVEHLPPPLREPVETRRRAIAELAGRLRLTHRQASLVLIECARVNRLLLECLFPDDQALTVYDAGGTDHWRRRGSLLDAER